ncbi:MAG: M3 family metallopeptidase [Candidatus Cloacimonetes bacterium]|nr:M3 family metallopeptidase [Candidatus Cloacimonadota bacterium]
MTETKNPFIESTEKYPFDAIPFDKISKEHYIPAIERGIKITKERIETIKNNPAEPDFNNVILAMDSSNEELTDVTKTYFNLYSSESDPEFKEMAQTISPMLSELSSYINMNTELFAKVKAVFDKKDQLNLSKEEARLLEITYKGFVRNGALLSDDDKEKLKKIDMELSTLGPKFSSNLLNSTNSYELLITDRDELKGLPENAIDAAAFRARNKGKEGYLFTLQIPVIIPVLTYAENRELRKTINQKFSSRAFRDDFDNQQLLKKIATLRHQRAQLLGFKTHAEYVLKERMAENPDTVMSFLDRIFEVAYPAAKNELNEIKQLAKELDGLDEIYPWDSAYYTEKLKQKKYSFDEEKLRPYFKMEYVVSGIFKVAEKLYGLHFEEINDVPVYHKDVMVYKVTEQNDKYVGLLYLDLFPRETKREGAWMTSFRTQGLFKGEVIRPHISIVTNFTPSTDKSPSLLRFSEVETLFHEFGHALHGLLSDCKFSTLASPNVYWDFVELPSQIMENWVKEKESLDLFARHFETNEKLPDDYIQKIKASENFNKGNFNLRQLSLGYLDMAWHNQDPSLVEDVAAFEDEVSEKTRLLPKVEGRNTSCSFAHIFAGGYSSGYYSYKWAEVLEADAFSLFLETGIFNKETASSFRNNLLSKGNSEHPMDLYVKFRGRKPDPDALLRRDGLI